VTLDGVFRDEQLRSDFAVAIAAWEMREHFDLPCSEGYIVNMLGQLNGDCGRH